ncbi:MAG: DUF3108 domain-containing protein [Bdellovibrionales bacterium]|nr:DUF3108 domain-containing protein [Bdellovibrionales bacterium]
MGKSKRIVRTGLLFYLLCLLFSCASGVLQYKQVEKLEINEEYDKKIRVKEIPPTRPVDDLASVPQGPVQSAELNAAKGSKAPMKAFGKKSAKKRPATGGGVKHDVTKGEVRKGKVEFRSSGKRQPEGEDSEGFLGRRPLVDPFVQGEKIVLSVSYFRMRAGELSLESRPLVEVNGRKAYHFLMRIKSHSLFERIYAVDDWAETFLDYEELTPYNLAVHLKESKQIKESRSVYDFVKLEADFWEKRVTSDQGEENKKISWKIEPYSQNVLSAIFYLRTFSLKQGKVIAFKIADSGKNILFRAEVVREESIEFKEKNIQTSVLKIEFEQDGVFQKTGDVFIWLTKDDRKFPVRIESKIKIGTLVGSLQSLQPSL